MRPKSLDGPAKRYTAIDSFCGAGGLSLGLSTAGFKIVGAFDIDPIAVETHKANLEGPCWVFDARFLRGRELLRLCGVKELDLFAGGPPCQGFSKQKRGAHLGDDRNSLVLEFGRLVKEIEPRFFLLEQVASFGQKRGRDFVSTIIGELNDYQVHPHFYDSSEYGLAQTRERFIIVGQRRDLGHTFRIPEPTERVLTVRDVIGDLPPPPIDYSNHPCFPNHQAAKVTKANLERFSHVPPGGGWKDIPVELRLKCHRENSGISGGWPDVYGRLQWDSQCPTLTAGFDSFTRGRYGHPEQNRPLTPREAARIQGFPDKFVFLGTRADIRKQIGNAVPPPLGRTVGEAVINALDARGLQGSELPRGKQRRSKSGYQLSLVTR